jgi:hypothetical protein
MTILNWQVSPEDVMIFSDTLCLYGEDKYPRNFITKIFPAPHLGTIIAGTGSAELLADFYFHTVGSMVLDDVVHLTEFAPELLRSLWSAKASHKAVGTSTLYTFGLAKEDGNFKSYAYRSTENFDTELIPYGVGVKPALQSVQLKPIEEFEGFIELARQQQEVDRMLPRVERVGIGGDLWYYFMSKGERGAVRIECQRLLRLEHYDQDHEMMLVKLPQNQGTLRSTLILAQDT